MKSGCKVFRLTKLFVLLLVLSGQTAAWSITDAQPAKESDSQYSQKQDALVEAARNFQEKPSDATYDHLWQQFTELAQQIASKHRDPVYTFKSWKALSQAGLKIIDVMGSNGTVKIYTFNPIKQANAPQLNAGIDSRNALIQWVEPGSALSQAAHTKQKKSRWAAKKLRSIATIKMQVVSVPNYVEIKEACLLPNSATTNGRYLSIAGSNLQTGNTWLMGLKRNSLSWINYPGLWQDVPPFLLQDGHAKVRLSGNNLIVILGDQANSTGSNAAYELVMPFVEDHFALSSKEAQDSASAVAHQFLLALQCKRSDLAKVWLADPKLSSIPGYLGLFSRTNTCSPLKLIGMSSPICGGSRFRLITSGKDDLIIDIGKIKAQWLIKALYIAPSDRLAKEIIRFLPNSQTANGIGKAQNTTD